MSDSNDATIQFTLIDIDIDIDVGSRLVEALVQHVKRTDQVPIAYNDLLTLGRDMYPKPLTHLPDHCETASKLIFHVCNRSCVYFLADLD